MKKFNLQIYNDDPYKSINKWNKAYFILLNI